MEEGITTGTMDVKRLINDYNEQLYAPKFDTLDEMEQFLEKHNLPKLTHKKTQTIRIGL